MCHTGLERPSTQTTSHEHLESSRVASRAQTTVRNLFGRRRRAVEFLVKHWSGRWIRLSVIQIEKVQSQRFPQRSIRRGCNFLHVVPRETTLPLPAVTRLKLTVDPQVHGLQPAGHDTNTSASHSLQGTVILENTNCHDTDSRRTHDRLPSSRRVSTDAMKSNFHLQIRGIGRKPLQTGRRKPIVLFDSHTSSQVFVVQSRFYRKQIACLKPIVPFWI